MTINSDIDYLPQQMCRYLLLITLLFHPYSALALLGNEANVIPHIDNEGREGFREFLASSKHRAFVVAPGGAWSWKSGHSSIESAIESAITECQQGTEQPCIPYAVDDRVVFNNKQWPTLWGPYLNKAEANKAHLGTERGDRFFDLIFKSNEGKVLTLSKLRGKVVVLHFWGTWCPSCRQEMPELHKLNRALGDNSNIEIVLLQVRENANTAQLWLQSQQLILPLYDSGVENARQRTFTLANGKSLQDDRVATVFPTTYILDKHGVIVFSHFGSVSHWDQYLPFLRDVANKSGK